MIRQCESCDFEVIYSIINDSAQGYKGVIPADRYKDQYMSASELRHEIDDRVIFWGYEEDGGLVGVMGIQHNDRAFFYFFCLISCHMSLARLVI